MLQAVVERATAIGECQMAVLDVGVLSLQAVAYILMAFCSSFALQLPCPTISPIPSFHASWYSRPILCVISYYAADSR